MSTNAAAGSSQASVTGCLTWDHARLDGILESAHALVRGARWPEALNTYGAFEQGLERHIRVEEDLIFPLFEARTGIVDGPTAVLRDEHRTIRSAMALMRQGIEHEDATTFREGLAFLQSVLPEHNAKEEHVLYPTTDRLLSDQDLAKLAARLRRELSPK